MLFFFCLFFFFQAEDGIRYLVRSRGLGDVYKRQLKNGASRKLCIDCKGFLLTMKIKIMPTSSEKSAAKRVTSAGARDSLSIKKRFMLFIKYLPYFIFALAFQTKHVEAKFLIGNCGRIREVCYNFALMHYNKRIG